MTGPSRLPLGQWRADDLNGMPEEECVCLACGLILLSQRRLGQSHRRDFHRSFDVDFPAFVPYHPPRRPEWVTELLAR